MENKRFSGYNCARVSASSREDCQKQCSATKGCTAATHLKAIKQCWLQNVPDDVEPVSARMSDSMRMCLPGAV